MALPNRFACHWLVLLFVVLTVGSCSTGDKKNNTSQSSGKSTIVTRKVSDIELALQYLDSLVKDTCFRNAGMGILVTDMTTGKTRSLVSYNADMSLVPASVMKIFTTATALEVLGGNKSFGTILQYSGQITGRTLAGNLYIKGGGDPTFYPERAFDRWVTAVRELDIDTINGNIIGDARIFDRFPIPLTWTWGELNSSYGAAASGLSISGNVYELKASLYNRDPYLPGAGRLQPYMSDFIFHNHVREADIAEESFYITGDPYGYEKHIEGWVPKGEREFSCFGSLPDPPAAAASLFLDRLIKKGIYVTGKYYNLSRISDTTVLKTLEDKRISLGSSFSPGVATLVHIANQESNNLYAEHQIKPIGLNRYHNGSDDSGARAITEFWKSKGMDTGGLYIFDGCGISRYNGITARQLVFVLQYMRKSPYSDVFYNSLPLAGVTGTLRTMFNGTPAEGNLRAKTGTMSRVKSLTGYMRTKTNKSIVFAIILNNFNTSQAEIKQKLEKFLNGLMTL
jgi:D-alanyl-D-alanine carboxypeptidase/D-alanyl-D-alanine-endopeptidase (penicillin-binding protein 4)